VPIRKFVFLLQKILCFAILVIAPMAVEFQYLRVSGRTTIGNCKQAGRVLFFFEEEAMKILSPEQEHLVELTEAELHAVAGGAITQTNNGGNTPNGNANGIPATNPAGFAPPGQNQ
jgi:hypothetical protein